MNTNTSIEISKYRNQINNAYVIEALRALKTATKDVLLEHKALITSGKIEDRIELMANVLDINVAIMKRYPKLYYQHSPYLKLFQFLDEIDDAAQDHKKLENLIKDMSSFISSSEATKQLQVRRRITKKQEKRLNYLSLISELKKQIGDDILKMKILKNVNSQSFSKVLGISRQQLDKYESGVETISEDVLAKIAEIIGTKINNSNSSVITDGKPELDKKIFSRMMKHYLDLKEAQKALEKLEG